MRCLKLLTHLLNINYALHDKIEIIMGFNHSAMTLPDHRMSNS